MGNENWKRYHDWSSNLTNCITTVNRDHTLPRAINFVPSLVTPIDCILRLQKFDISHGPPSVISFFCYAESDLKPATGYDIFRKRNFLVHHMYLRMYACVHLFVNFIANFMLAVSSRNIHGLRCPLLELLLLAALKVIVGCYIFSANNTELPSHCFSSIVSKGSLRLRERFYFVE